jgi:hypothetical protein
MKHALLSLGLALTTLVAQAYQTSDLTVRLEKNGLFTVVVNGKKQASNCNVFRFDQIVPGMHSIQVLRNNYWGSPAVVYRGRIRVPRSSKVKATLNNRNQMMVSFRPLVHHGNHQGGSYGQTTSLTAPGYGGHYQYPQPVVCGPPAPVHFGMASFQFNRTRERMDDVPFDDDKLMISRQAIRMNGISAEQLRTLLYKLTFDSSKLKLAKFAYEYVSDSESYFLLNDAFTFSSSGRELDNFICGH